MDHYFSQKVKNTPFNKVLAQVMTVLQAEEFGILGKINVLEIFKKKPDVNFRKYIIPGACNPS